MLHSGTLDDFVIWYADTTRGWNGINSEEAQYENEEEVGTCLSRGRATIKDIMRVASSNDREVTTSKKSLHSSASRDTAWTDTCKLLVPLYYTSCSAWLRKQPQHRWGLFHVSARYASMRVSSAIFLIRRVVLRLVCCS